MFIPPDFIATVPDDFEPFACWLCTKLGQIISIFPSTPISLTLGNLIVRAGEFVPFVGSGIIYELFNMVKSVLLILGVQKMLRLIFVVKFL
jgi:hypothetical protein